MSAINEVWGKPRYYMVCMTDKTWCITRGNPAANATIIKSDLTRAEAEAFMKLLREQ